MNADFCIPVDSKLSLVQFGGSSSPVSGQAQGGAVAEAQFGDQGPNFGLIGGPVVWQLARRSGMLPAVAVFLRVSGSLPRSRGRPSQRSWKGANPRSSKAGFTPGRRFGDSSARVMASR
jgi:hypothetical protein